MEEQWIRELKNEIETESAINVGFFTDVVAEIIKIEPLYLMDVMADMGEHLTFRARENDWGMFQNMLVTEAVRHMDFEDFTKIAKYFFGYRMTEEEILAEPIEITRENFLEFQKNSKELHELKYSVPDLKERVHKRTHFEKKNDNEVVAYDPVNNYLAVIEPGGWGDPHLELAENLISDYGRSESNEEVLIEYLMNYNPNLFKNAVEGKYDESEMTYQDYWLEKIDNNKKQTITEINNLLEPLGKEVYSYTGRGYFQGDVWELYYLKDAEDKNENIDYFLEHTVTAYYRGSLSEVSIYDENDEFLELFLYDRELTWNESPEKYVNENVEFSDSYFVNMDTAYLLESIDMEVTKEDIDEIWKMTMEERESYLSEGKEKHI